MSEFKISCNVSPSGEKPLGFSVLVDSQVYFDTDALVEEQFVEISLSDDEGDHELKFVLKGKATDHTQIDKEGNILNDSLVLISDLKFDDIALGYTANKLSTYHHDFNGTGTFIDDQFFGGMGCNGTVSLKFSTPIYLWLLENM